MISFLTKYRRSIEVDAWEVEIEALYSPSDDHLANDGFSKALDDDPNIIEDSHFCSCHKIASLKAIVAGKCYMTDPEDLHEFMARHGGLGATFDISQLSYHTSTGFEAWLGRGGDEKVFSNWVDPIQSVILTSELITDPHVDRGAILGYMIPHLSAFSSGRLIIVHQEILNSKLPKDQQGRIIEHYKTLVSLGRSLHYSVAGFDCGVEVLGADVTPVKNRLGEVTTRGGDLPLFVFDMFLEGHEDVQWYITDDVEIEALDIGDWAQERFGVRPTTEEGAA